MPPDAASKSPGFARFASVNAPASNPKSSASSMASGMAAQLTSTNGPAKRGPLSCITRATRPFPVPVSPSRRTVGARWPPGASKVARCRIWARSASMPGASPRITSSSRTRSVTGVDRNTLAPRPQGGGPFVALARATGANRYPLRIRGEVPGMWLALQADKGGSDDGSGKTGSVRGEGSWGHRIGADGVAGGDRGQTGALPGHGGRTSRHLGRAGEADERGRAVRPRMARGAGGRGLRDVRSGHRPLHAAGGARGRAERREQPGVRPRRLPGDDGGDAGRAQGGRGVPHRQGRRLARARSRPVRGRRALLPARLQRQPRRRVDPRAGRRQGEARAGRARRRHRLRARRLDDHHGAGVSQVALRRASTTIARRSSGRASARNAQGSATG